MKLKRLSRFAAFVISSLVSVFSGHSLQANSGAGKDLTKNKKNDTSESQTETDTAVAAQLPKESTPDQFPWRYSIVTTTFWIGEKPTQNNPVPNHKSSWDTRWAENYGGTDTPDRKQRTSEYIPVGLTPGQNPFYIALPYNDKTLTGHKAEAPVAVPWFHEAYESPAKSVLKGRWIAIRRGDRVCYAQWEDAGPFRTDHWQYVFGNERPKANLNNGAGLDVSPAVRDFLGMDDTDVTDWKFVEFEDVPPGPWARYGDNNDFVINRRTTAARVLASGTAPL